MVSTMDIKNRCAYLNSLMSIINLIKIKCLSVVIQLTIVTQTAVAAARRRRCHVVRVTFLRAVTVVQSPLFVVT